MSLNESLPPLLVPAAELLTCHNRASVALLQQYFKLPYSHATALMMALKDRGAVVEIAGKRHVAPGAEGLARGNVLEFADLHVQTLIGRENRQGSLMLCGINHGESAEDQQKDQKGEDRREQFFSFFSDTRVNNFPYRNRIVKLLGLLGHPLKGDCATAGVFEKSIVQTNWLTTASQNVDDVVVERECIAHPEDFLNTCARLEPALIIFFSGQMMDAFNSPQLAPRLEKLFGPAVGNVKWIQKDDLGTRFKIGIRHRERVTAIALPHPTGAFVSDKYIAAFAPELAPLIKHWWTSHSERLEAAGIRSFGMTPFRASPFDELEPG
ncbi:MAG: hypothetical protein V4731_06195 [Pseudomonadota bacterium]